MKKRIAIIITSVVFLLVISITSIYAWYINQSRVDVLNPSTNGIVFNYKVDGNEILTDTFEIKDVAFFDVDSEHEGKFFTDMAVVAAFQVTNKSSRTIDIEFSYTTPVDTNSPYIACIFSTEEKLDSTEATGSVESYLTENSLAGTSTAQDLAKDASVTVYAYIYGIQPNDAANNDFLDETYSITFKIEGVQS